MSDHDHSDRVQQMSGQVGSMFYLVDEPMTILMIQIDGQMLTTPASFQSSAPVGSVHSPAHCPLHAA
jgi:hypothetical protein